MAWGSVSLTPKTLRTQKKHKEQIRSRGAILRHGFYLGESSVGSLSVVNKTKNRPGYLGISKKRR